MAEETDPESKTEDASPKRLEDARRKGDVAKSQDLPAFLSLAGAFGVLAVGGAAFSQSLAEALIPFVAAPHELMSSLETGGAREIARHTIFAVLPILLAIMLAAMIGGAGGNLMQHGLLFTPNKLAPDWKRLNPLSAFKRLFGVDNLVQFLKTAIKLIVTGVIAWQVTKDDASEIISLVRKAPFEMLVYARELIISLFIAVLAFLGVSALVDWMWQRFRFAQRMRMSREEVKEEFKQSEGDPHVKARLRQIRIERSRRRMMAAVPKATLVVTNPTHYAIALRYVAGETPAPICLAKGVDAVALKIREIATEHEVPIVEDPPLARALFATVDLDETIPREHYEAVAKLIGFVLGQKQPRRAAPGRL